MIEGKCINCTYAIKKNRIPEGVLVVDITCDNPDSKYYGKKITTSETYPVDNYDCDKGDIIDITNDNDAHIKAVHSPGSLVIKNARDRFVNLLNSSDSETFEEILTEFIHKFGDTIPVDQCCQIIQLLSEISYSKIAQLNRIKHVAKEHATYLSTYLDGKMYTDNDNFKKYNPIQKQNAQVIIDVCNE